MAKGKNTETQETKGDTPTPRRTRSLDPHVTTPAATVKVDRLARFVFVPDTGFHCGDAKEWLARGTLEWKVLQKTPKLGSFLSQNPMTVVYARITGDETVQITQISMGGAFLSERMARGILPFLPWHGDDVAKNARPVVDPDEEGKTLPKSKTSATATTAA